MRKVSRFTAKPGTSRKKECVAVPVAKVTMDIADLFLGQTEIKTEYDSKIYILRVNIKIEGIKYLSFSIQLDQPLLSPEQFLMYAFC
jgi:hemin uptake protein HemP